MPRDHGILLGRDVIKLPVLRNNVIAGGNGGGERNSAASYPPRSLRRSNESVLGWRYGIDGSTDYRSFLQCTCLFGAFRLRWT